MKEDIFILAQAYTLGDILEPPVQIAGGRSHQLWQCVSQQGRFAVKKLAIEPQQKKKLAEIRETERLAYFLSQYAIPALAALQHKHDPIFCIAENCYLVYPWINGFHIFPTQVKPAQAYGIGKILRQLHQFPVDTIVPKIQLPLFTYHALPESQWQALADAAIACRLPYADRFKEYLPTLINIDQQGNIALGKLEEARVICHGDIDPYNVLWLDTQSFYLIDWELANLAPPVVDFVVCCSIL